MANIFDIDWNNVGTNLVPHFWRKDALLAYVHSIYAPIQELSDSLLAFQQETETFLKYTGQHKVLEEYLNDTYDVTLRRIFLTENDIAAIDAISIYLSGETTSAPLELYLSGETPTVPVNIYLSGEAIIGYNFTVHVPTAIVFDSSLMTSRLNNYVEASKIFNIVTF